MDLWVSILTVGRLVTVFTSMGGMKAVLWTDSFQFTLIITGLLTVVIQGSIVMGGLSHAWKIAYNNSKIHFHEFSANPGTRHSFWSVVVGGGVMWMSFHSVNQRQIQRVLACPTLKKAQTALWIKAGGLLCINSLAVLAWILIFAVYSDCRPLKFNNLITTTDELLPLFVMDILGHQKGLPGVFLSCVFSGSLSTLSSGINALSAVALQDYIRPYCPCTISDIHATIITKVAGTTGCPRIWDIIITIEVSYMITSVLDGPLFGTFILGMFFPRANKTGALIGYLFSLAFLCWIDFGAYFHNVNKPTTNFSVAGCNWNVTNMTMQTVDNATVSTNEDNYLNIYRLSYLYYTATGAFVTIVIGGVVVAETEDIQLMQEHTKTDAAILTLLEKI